jgi:hypothetical protein
MLDLLTIINRYVAHHPMIRPGLPTMATGSRRTISHRGSTPLRYKTEWGIPNCLFIHAQNKQTIPTILRPLRKLGIPAAGIVDIDVLKEGGTVWGNLVDGAGLPGLEHNSVATLRANVRTAMDATGKDMKTDGGTAILSGNDKEAAENLLARLAEYGIFVTPGGELELLGKDVQIRSNPDANCEQTN